MPSVSRAQQAAMAIAEHAPGKLNPGNRGLLNMSGSQLHDFAATPTRGLPRYVGQYPKMAAGGAVDQPPPSYYGQGGEADVTMAARPVLPNTPSMPQPTSVGYAQGGNVLSAGQRKALPSSDFAVPGKAPGAGSYPMPDRAHAANAKARASQFGSPAVKTAVAAKAKAKFGMAKGGVVGGTDPQTEAAKPPMRGLLKRKPSRAARVAKFEQDNGDQEI